jgi:hypothetical protein
MRNKYKLRHKGLHINRQHTTDTNVDSYLHKYVCPTSGCQESACCSPAPDLQPNEKIAEPNFYKALPSREKLLETTIHGGQHSKGMQKIK